LENLAERFRVYTVDTVSEYRVKAMGVNRKAIKSCLLLQHFIPLPPFENVINGGRNIEARDTTIKQI
jgi:hypothetical protein